MRNEDNKNVTDGETTYEFVEVEPRGARGSNVEHVVVYDNGDEDGKRKKLKSPQIIHHLRLVSSFSMRRIAVPQRVEGQ